MALFFRKNKYIGNKTIMPKFDSRYCFWAGITLIMFYYAHAEFLPIEKAFYIPCAIAFIISLFVRKRWDKIDTLLGWFLALVWISDLANGIYPESISSNCVRITLGVVCFNKLRKCNLSSVSKWVAYISPLIVISYYIFDNPLLYVGWERYGGFSGDPNYLSISLNLLCVIMLQQIGMTKSKTWRAIWIVSILLIIPIIIAGKSRIGSVSFCVIILFAGYKLLRKSKIFFLILAIFGSGAMIYMSNTNPSMIDQFVMRFDGSRKSDQGAAMARFKQIDGVIATFKDTPYIIFFGIGADSLPQDIESYKTKSANIVHNTFFNIFLQEGIFTLFFFCYILWICLKRIWEKRDLIMGGLFLSLLMNINSVSCTTYLTFWWSLFFIFSETHDTTKDAGCNRNKKYVTTCCPTAYQP